MKYGAQFHRELVDIHSLTDRASVKEFMNRPIFTEMLDDGDEEDRIAVGDLFESLASSHPAPQKERAQAREENRKFGGVNT